MSDIRIGHRVRVRAGMHTSAVGDVVEVHPAAPNPYAIVESRGERIAAFVGVLDVLDDGPSSMRAGVEALHAAVMQMLAHEEDLSESLPDDDAVTHQYAHSVLSEIAESLRVILGGER